MTDRATYQTRGETVYAGECSVCGFMIRPKTTSGGKQEWFCHMCGGARHFCKHPQCFFLHELFYSECEGDTHKKVPTVWGTTLEQARADEEAWLQADIFY